MKLGVLGLGFAKLQSSLGQTRLNVEMAGGNAWVHGAALPHRAGALTSSFSASAKRTSVFRATGHAAPIACVYYSFYPVS